ncbi:signal recognition particle subunit [Dimargaris verticillata]|uniref:Signal recognition particle subunit n=1 Tax=Dimargaris verticillata TaxID=2761393 RepID=A0A9W8EFH6_9FUNG|nr:signal recognition particle subunit [Dimargaris verticillata]
MSKGKQPQVTIEDDHDDIDAMDFPLPLVPAGPPQASAQLPKDRVNYVTDDAAFKSWVCLYPAYFDRNRSFQKGRRVSHDVAVDRPKARHIAEAVSRLHLRLLYEPEKIYPRDFLNPGRVKVELKDDNGQTISPTVSNRRALYHRVALLLPAMKEEVVLDEPDLDAVEAGKQLQELMENRSKFGLGGGPPMDTPEAIEPPPAPTKKSAKSAKSKKKPKRTGRLV